MNGRVVRTIPLRVEPDPLLRISEADRNVWHQAAKEAHELQRLAYDAGARFAALAGHVASLEQAVKQQPVNGNVAGRVEELTKRVAGLRPRLSLPAPGALGGDAGSRVTNLPGQLASLKMQLIGATDVPTAIQRRTLAQARTGLADAVRETNDVLTKDLPAVVSLLEQQGLRLALTPLAPLPAVPQQ
jgi:hypothetical protein